MRTCHAEFCIRCIEPVSVFLVRDQISRVARLGMMSVSRVAPGYTYVARYAKERLIFSAALFLTSSNTVSQKRASGHRDMTPNVTGTRCLSLDHGRCTPAEPACAIARHSDRADRRPSIVVVVVVAVRRRSSPEGESAHKDVPRFASSPRAPSPTSGNTDICPCPALPCPPALLYHLSPLKEAQAPGAVCLGARLFLCSPYCRPPIASSHHRRASRSDCGGWKYLHLETNASTERCRIIFSIARSLRICRYLASSVTPTDKGGFAPGRC